MKKIALILFYIVFFLAALLFFTPKESIYYYGEEQLKPLGVILAQEEAVDTGFSLKIEHAKLYVQKIKSANIALIELTLLGVYNTVSVENIVLDKTFEQFFPPLVEHLEVTQSILAPVKVSATAHGDFGTAAASVHLVDRNGTVLLTPSKMMRSRYKNTLRQLKRTKTGDYRYDFKF